MQKHGWRNDVNDQSWNDLNEDLGDLARVSDVNKNLGDLVGVHEDLIGWSSMH